MPTWFTLTFRISYVPDLYKVFQLLFNSCFGCFEMRSLYNLTACLAWGSWKTVSASWPGVQAWAILPAAVGLTLLDGRRLWAWLLRSMLWLMLLHSGKWSFAFRRWYYLRRRIFRRLDPQWKGQEATWFFLHRLSLLRDFKFFKETKLLLVH